MLLILRKEVVAVLNIAKMFICRLLMTVVVGIVKLTVTPIQPGVPRVTSKDKDVPALATILGIERHSFGADVKNQKPNVTFAEPVLPDVGLTNRELTALAE